MGLLNYKGFWGFGLKFETLQEFLDLPT
jgi:hypothetical protein